MNTLETFLAALPGGFLSDATLPELVKLDRLHAVLVRCGGCRFTCSAQYVDHLLAIIEKDGRDYVRDISVPAGSLERAKDWKPEPPGGYCSAWTRAASAPAHKFPPMPEVKPVTTRPVWDETQCGGVFDGQQVTSDADPGL